MDQSSRDVRVLETPIELTATEFDLLWTLMSRPGHVFARANLIDIVYGTEIVVADRTIDTFIKRIRRKLGDVEPSFQPIETIRSVGYRFLNRDS